MPYRPDGSEAGDGGAPAVLDDDAPLTLRPAGHDDGPAILDGFARCSAATRYFRFQSGGYQLTEARVTALTDADHRVHAVWLALDPEVPGSHVAGVARFVRSPEEPDTAEVAFIVADDYQGRGLGRLMLDALRVSASVDGVTEFVANVLAENGPMLALLLNRGARVVRHDGPEIQIRLPLDSPDLPAIDPRFDRALRDRAAAAAAAAEPGGREPTDDP